MSEAKAGTFLCWLFGHKFIMWAKENSTYTLCPLNHCVRCGAERKE